MSNQSGDTATGFITGVQPAQPLTQAELNAMQNPGQQGQATPQVVINNGQPQGPQGQRMFTEEEVGAIRAEEKEKLYGRMTTMEQELETLRQEREAREAALAAAEEERAAAARSAEEQQMDVRTLIERRDQEWQTRFSEMEQERERDRAIFEQERRFTQLQDYRRDRIEQESEWILPELRDLIDGGNEVEIDQAIEIMKQRTGAILQSVQSAVTQQRAPLRGVAPTGAPPVGPMEQQTATQQVSVDDIRRMDTKTFAQYRDQLLGIATAAGVNGLRRDQAQQ
jgi:hypothetical protein